MASTAPALYQVYPWCFVLLLALALRSSSALSASSLASVLCIPTAMSLLEETEGRHRCAYDSPLGYRAVGVGYNLDDRSREREREVATVFSDWEKVYKGQECLNDVQINALLTFDARRALLVAAKTSPSLDNWCCNIQAVFADLSFSIGNKELGDDFEDTIQQAEHNDWVGAAKELKKTKWCDEHEKLCPSLVSNLKKGCKSVGQEYIKALRGFPVY